MLRRQRGFCERGTSRTCRSLVLGSFSFPPRVQSLPGRDFSSSGRRPTARVEASAYLQGKVSRAEITPIPFRLSVSLPTHVKKHDDAPPASKNWHRNDRR